PGSAESLPGQSGPRRPVLWPAAGRGLDTMPRLLYIPGESLMDGIKWSTRTAGMTIDMLTLGGPRRDGRSGCGGQAPACRPPCVALRLPECHRCANLRANDVAGDH